jgi:F-type H+-transporting ATPase subunit b
MAEHPGEHLTAETGTTELHHAEAAWGFMTAPAFVALSMLVVIAIILWKRVPAMIGKMLDAKNAAIRTQLDEATALRTEAEAELAEAKKRNASSAKDAAAIVAHAEAEAAAMIAKAEADAADLVKRRARMAEDKIGAAERAAIAEVRAKAADVAVQAAAALIADTHNAAADKPLVDKAIAGLARVN